MPELFARLPRFGDRTVPQRPTSVASQPSPGSPESSAKTGSPRQAARENRPDAGDASFIAGLDVPVQVSTRRRAHKKKQGFPIWLIATLAAVGVATIAGFGTAIYWSNQAMTNGPAKPDTQAKAEPQTKPDVNTIAANSPPADSGKEQTQCNVSLESESSLANNCLARRPARRCVAIRQRRADEVCRDGAHRNTPAVGKGEIPVSYPPARLPHCRNSLFLPKTPTKATPFSEWVPLPPMDLNRDSDKTRVAAAGPPESTDPARFASDSGNSRSPGLKTVEGDAMRPLPSPGAQWRQLTVESRSWRKQFSI